jgi:hypothetical protein
VKSLFRLTKIFVSRKGAMHAKMRKDFPFPSEPEEPITSRFFIFLASRFASHHLLAYNSPFNFKTEVTNV